MTFRKKVFYQKNKYASRFIHEISEFPLQGSDFHRERMNVDRGFSIKIKILRKSPLNAWKKIFLSSIQKRHLNLFFFSDFL